MLTLTNYVANAPTTSTESGGDEWHEGADLKGASMLAGMDTLDFATALRKQELSGAERRRGFRIAQNRPIKVYEPTAARYFGGQTEDVSATGLRIELPVSMNLRPGKMLNVHVGLSTTGQALANRRQMIPVRVVWVTSVKGKIRPTQEAGIEFLASIGVHLDAA